MGSFALWYEKKSAIGPQENKEFDAVLNFNLWLQFSKEKTTPILDLGLMLNNIQVANKIQLYIPFNLDKKELQDLGEVLQDPKTLNAVFNEHYECKANGYGKTFCVTNVKGETAFKVYKLNVDHDLVLESFDEGVVLSLSTENLPKDTKCYIRFRITSEKLQSLIRQYTPKNYLLESNFVNTYIIDFRVNYRRNLAPTLLERINSNGGFIKITKLHFLLMTKADVGVEGRKFDIIRELEAGIWEKYLGITSETITDVVAYHVKSVPAESEWEFFSRMRVGKCNKGTIFLYILVYTIISVVSSLIASGLIRLIKGS